MTERERIEDLHQRYLSLRENTPTMQRDGEECRVYHDWYDTSYVYFKSLDYLQNDPDYQIFVNAEKNGNCFVLEHIYDSISPSYKVLMKKTRKMHKTDTVESKGKKPLVFISHRGTQEAFVTALVSLLEGCGFTKDNLFCSSVPGFNIGLDEDIIETLRKKFLDYNLYVIYVFSTDFFENPYCLNEMGAAWVLQVDNSIIVTRNMDESKIDGVVDKNKTRVSFKGSDFQIGSRMIELRDKLTNFAGLPKVKEIEWRRHYTTFVEKIKAKGFLKQQTNETKLASRIAVGNPDTVVREAIRKLGEFTIKELQSETGFKDYNYVAEKVRALVAVLFNLRANSKLCVIQHPIRKKWREVTIADDNLKLYVRRFVKDLNNAGLLLFFNNQLNCVTLTGDAYYSTVEQVTNDAISKLNCRGDYYMVVPHHGGYAGKFTCNIDARVNKRAAIISVGASNSYGHPSSSVESSLRNSFQILKETKDIGTDIIYNL